MENIALNQAQNAPLPWEAYLAIFENFPQVLYVTDPKTHEVIFVNKTFRDMLGADTVGQKCYRAFQGFDAPCEFCTNDIILTRPGPYSWEYHNPMLNTDFFITDQIIQWPDGRDVRFEVAVDITRQKVAERARQESEKIFRDLFELGLMGMTITDPDTKAWLEINPRLCQMLGYSAEELQAMSWAELTHPDDLEPDVKQFTRMLNGEIDGYLIDKRFMRKDGVVLHVELSVRGLRRADGSVQRVYALLNDITARKIAEERLQKMVTDLERSNRELEQFAYVASHDLQEPLRMVSSYTQLLERRYKDKLDGDALEFIQFAVDGANRMQRLINDLLAFSRINTQGKPPEPVDSHAALGQALVQLGAAIRESGAIVTNGDLPLVKADPGQLVQLFQNLIANGIKFQGDQAPRIHVSAEPGPGGQVLFSVRDNGIGIDMQYKDRIFQIFQRLHGKGEYPGTGIGLAVCQRIVERHGGTIRVESEPGCGATFFFTINT